MVKVAVFGAGTMGHGIALVSAMKYETTLIDINEDILKKAIERMRKNLKRLAEEGKIKNADEIISRIKASTKIDDCRDADIIIEAIPEKEDLKINLFRNIEKIAGENAIIATNTSSIPINSLSKNIKRKGNFIGLHFFNPPYRIKLVEIVLSEFTEKSILEIVKNFLENLGMDYIVVKKDVPGFVVNRINLRIFESAFKLAYHYSIEDIDAVAKYRLNLPMGFFELFDFIGLDVLLDVINSLKKYGFQFTETSLLEEKVKSGKLGNKTGEGFYKHDRKIQFPRDKIYSINPLEFIAAGVNEAAWLIKENVANIDDIEKGMKKGMNYPKGLLVYADEYGIDEIVNFLNNKNLHVNDLLLSMVKNGKLGLKTGNGFHSWPYERKEFPRVIYEKRRDHAWITMNREDKLNALDDQLWIDLKKAYEIANKDKNVKCIILTGKGNAFCAGDDINVMASWKNKKDAENFFAIASEAIKEIFYSDKTTIALVNGHAHGGGLEILIGMDFVIASEDAVLSLPEIKIGAIPPIAPTIGATLGRKIRRYILTGEIIPVERAKEIGIVDEIVPKEQLSIVGTEFSIILSKNSPEAIKIAKNLMRKTFVDENRLDEGLSSLVDLTESENFKEGTRAFIEKRDPKWKEL